MFKIETVDHIAITVTDIDKSIAWYADVLGLKHVHKEIWEGEPAFVVSENGSGLALFQADLTEKEIKPDEIRYSVRHFAFRVDKENFEMAKDYLTSKDIKFRFEDHGVCYSIYFNDPDGHKLEITTYEI